MKTCPVCNQAVFDDLEVCFGCMYRFGSNPELERQSAELNAPDASGSPTAFAAPAAPSASDGASAASAVAALATVSPVAAEPAATASTTTAAAPVAALESEACQWTIRLEMRNGSDPGQSWAVEFKPPWPHEPKDGAAYVQAPSLEGLERNAISEVMDDLFII